VLYLILYVAASHAYFNLGVLYQKDLQNTSEALKCFKKSFEMKIKAGMASDHPDIKETKEFIASCNSSLVSVSAT
jgi:hypothetical protein